MADDIEKRLIKLEVWKDGNGAKGAETRIQENTMLANKACGDAAIASGKADKSHERQDIHMDWHKAQTAKMNWFVGVVAVQLITWLLREFIFPLVNK